MSSVFSADSLYSFPLKRNWAVVMVDAVIASNSRSRYPRVRLPFTIRSCVEVERASRYPRMSWMKIQNGSIFAPSKGPLEATIRSFSPLLPNRTSAAENHEAGRSPGAIF